MEKLEPLENYSVYEVGIKYRSDVDPAIANISHKLYKVLSKTSESAIEKVEEKFKKDFPDKIIEKVIAFCDVRLEDCLR